MTIRSALALSLLVVMAVIAVVMAVMAPVATPSQMAGGTAVADGWGEDYAQTLAEAKKSGKPILADFTGSDWCGWCIRLKKEVFDTPAFKEWADKNVILLELDFPNQKAQTAAIKQQNENLSKQFSIEGFPTVLIIDANGKKIGELGYMDGGPEKWITEFKNQFVAATKP